MWLAVVLLSRNPFWLPRRCGSIGSRIRFSIMRLYILAMIQVKLMPRYLSALERFPDFGTGTILERDHWSGLPKITICGLKQ